MSDDKPRLPKPESLEAKFKLMTLLPYDKRAKRKHCLVFGFVCDWYHSDYGNALASVRHIVATIKERDPAGIGLYTGDVHSALADLVSWGYLTQIKGTGRKASRYIPAWDLVCVHKTPNTTATETSIRGNPNTDVRENPNTNGDSVHKMQNEDPSTVPVHGTGVHVVGNMFEAAPVAPPLAGLPAATAGPASGDGFSEFWSAWPRKHGKKAAEAEWRKIGADLRATVINAAGVWADHYAKHGVEKKWIPEPANWLKGERWDEDLPLIHGDAKGAAIAKAKANAPAKKEDKPRWPRVVDIVGSGVDNDGDFRTKLKLVFCERDQPKTWEHVITIEHPNTDIQRDGQREFGALCSALGLVGVNDSSELENHAVEIMPGNKGALEYRPAPANDNMEAAA
ncbi:hypothetical protein [Ensifer sesbaniae]|uniref:hypothetical protein n=1 Tax=Ensifer sesbaniae TaxID=1214071 RepID=UPI001568AE1C|nr:hypothetical protein [Ensifer sesbaniae]NRQ15576.1 hypothetical protein [Ensifer sesbaniae]